MSEHPLSRRDALAAMAAGAGVVLSGCGPSGDGGGAEGAAGGGGATAGGAGDAAPAAWVKDASPFVQHGTNLETRLADLDGLLTPNDLFFVRNHAPTPMIDPASYRLAVGGPGAERQVELSLDELRALPSHTLISYIECAGNWRGFFQRVTGRAASGSQWGTG
ncbi:MAG: molybdopterin-dependent oxidoreductase, partial [Gemmatimonadetes bacterium]|nr:molybdopterin-dependent oxidoreductase [Gemmatimonadota bacterium]